MGIFITALKAAFNWAVDEELISANPVARLKKPSPRSRGADNRLTEAQFQRVLARVTPRFRDFLVALNDTGARPGEVAQVTAADYHPDLHAWVLATHKTDRTGKKKTIHLTPRVEELVLRLSKEHPEGPIFRNRLGKPWTTGTLAKYFERVREDLGLGNVTPYAVRHKFGTEFLLEGGTYAQLKEFMGSTVAVLEKHYGHLDEHPEATRKLLLDFRGGSTSGPGETSGPEE